jgi:transposase
LAACEEIKSQLCKDGKFSQGIRLYAVYQIALGKTAEELSALYFTGHKSVCNRVHRYDAEGVEGLKDRPRCSRRSRLEEAQKLKIKADVLESLALEGFSSGVWTRGHWLAGISGTISA